jgi:hypothetical protein
MYQRLLLNKLITAYPVHDNASAIEVWKYDPAIFKKNESVDVLSLFLSLKDSADERVESASHRI